MMNASFVASLTDIGSGSFSGSLPFDLTAIFVLAFSGPIVFWVPATTEVICAMAGAEHIHPVLVGAAAAAGQCVLFGLLFCFGERIANRVACLRTSVDSVAGKRSTLLQRGKYALSIGAGGIGFPPTVPLFTLAPSLNMSLTPMIVRVMHTRHGRVASSISRTRASHAIY